jgi:hypothetical protein
MHFKLVDLGLVVDLRLPGVLLHRGDAVFAGGFCGVALAGGDDLVVVGAQPPAELPLAIFVDFEFGHDDPPLEFDVELSPSQYILFRCALQSGSAQQIGYVKRGIKFATPYHNIVGTPRWGVHKRFRRMRHVRGSGIINAQSTQHASSIHAVCSVSN